MRRTVGLIVLGIVIAGIAAPMVPLAILTLDLTDLRSRLSRSEMRLFASDLDPSCSGHSWADKAVPGVKSDQANAVLLIC
jgi:hypothetical protein